MARILLVEDNVANLQLMQYILTAFKHDAVGCLHSKEALEIAVADHFDLILSDVLMPEMDGFEFVRRYRERCDGRTPVVAVTALAMVGDQDRIMAAGFDGYIPKPITPETFIPAVESFLKTAADDRPMILAVDDLAINLDVLQQTLEPFGFRVVRASNVTQAIRIIDEQRPALILCDIHMPGGNGFELIEHVKSDAALASIPLFVMSSTAWQTSERQRAMKLGAEQFILRPIDPETLVSAVRGAIER